MWSKFLQPKWVKRVCNLRMCRPVRSVFIVGCEQLQNIKIKEILLEKKGMVSIRAMHTEVHAN